MSRERWFRGSDEAAAFDWYRPARDLEIPIEIARALYIRAMQRAIDVQRAEALYLRWLHDAAARQAETSAQVPGRQTRVIRETEQSQRTRRHAELARLGPGKWTRSLLETSEERLPGAE